METILLKGVILILHSAIWAIGLSFAALLVFCAIALWMGWAQAEVDDILGDR